MFTRITLQGFVIEITGFLGRYQLKYLSNNIFAIEKNYIKLESIAKENSDLVTLNRSHISLLSSFAYPVICKDPMIKDK